MPADTDEFGHDHHGGVPRPHVKVDDHNANRTVGGCAAPTTQ
jgi:hypothetical protein